MELDVLTSVGKHQNLVEFYGACVQDPTNPVILEEFVEGPNLEHYLEASAQCQLLVIFWLMTLLRIVAEEESGVQLGSHHNLQVSSKPHLLYIVRSQAKSHVRLWSANFRSLDAPNVK
jgi:serine/threonine protein kinase